MSLSSTHTKVAAHLQRCTQKDPSGLSALINTYGPTLHRYACGLFAKQHADQLTQDGFALIWQHANLYHSNQGDPLGWILSIFRYRLAQALGSQRYERAQAVSLDQLLLNNSSTSPFLDVIHALPHEQKKILLGRYLFAWDKALCVLHIGASEDEIEQQFRQACQQIVRQFSPWEINNPDWQAENGQACLESLRPQNNHSALLQRRQNDAKALTDTLRWEALCADLCQFLPTAAENQQWIAGLSARLGIPLQRRPSVPQRPAAATIAEPPPTTGHQSQAPASDKTKAAPIPTQVLKKAATTPEPQPTESTSNADSEYTDELRQQRRYTNYWKFFSVVNLVLVIGLLVWMLLPKPPPIEVIQMAPRLGAVLQAPGHSATPGWVLSVDPQQQVLLSPLVPTQLKEGEQVHLWTRDASDSKLRSLGLINPNQPVTLTKENLGTIQEGQLFEMTLESSQRADPNEPQGPILFMGRVVSLGDYEPKDATPQEK